MSLEKAVFDPFARAWEVYGADGPEGLEVIEAPMFVCMPDPELAEQVASGVDGLEAEDLKWMVLPDASPVADGHLNIVGGRGISYRQASDPERHVMDVLTHATEQHVEEIVQPDNGIGVYRFGRIPTMHAHVVPRREWADGLDWTTKRPLISVDERRLVRDALGFDKVPGRIDELHTRIAAALLRFA